MAVYAISLVLIILIYLVLKRIKAKIKDFDKVFLMLTGIYITILSGLRSVNVGTDVLNYKTIFEYFGTKPLFVQVPSNLSGLGGYRLLCKVVYIIFNGNYQVMLFISGAIIMYGFFVFIYYYSDNCVASVFYFISLYCLFFTWNGVRQSIAMSLFFISICYFDRKKYKTFLIYALLAISIHNVVALMYIYPLLRIMNWNKLTYFFYLAVIIAGTLMVDKFIVLFCNIFPRYSIYLNNLSQGNLSSFGGESRGRKIVLSIGLLIFIIIAMIFFKKDMFKPLNNYQDNENKKRESLWTFMSVTTIDIVIGILFSTNTFFLRVQTFFSIFSIVFLPAVIERIDKKWRWPIYTISVILFLITTIVRLQSNNSGVNPYEFFFKI